MAQAASRSRQRRKPAAPRREKRVGAYVSRDIADALLDDYLWRAKWCGFNQVRQKDLQSEWAHVHRFLGGSGKNERPMRVSLRQATRDRLLERDAPGRYTLREVPHVRFEEGPIFMPDIQGALWLRAPYTGHFIPRAPPTSRGGRGRSAGGRVYSFDRFAPLLLPKLLDGLHSIPGVKSALAELERKMALDAEQARLTEGVEGPANPAPLPPTDESAKHLLGRMEGLGGLRVDGFFGRTVVSVRRPLHKGRAQMPDSLALAVRFDAACDAVWRAIESLGMPAAEETALKRLLDGTTVFFWSRMIQTLPPIVARSRDHHYPQLQVLPAEFHRALAASLRRGNMWRATQATAPTHLTLLVGAGALTTSFPPIEEWESFASGFSTLGVSEEEARQRSKTLGHGVVAAYEAAAALLSDIGAAHLQEVVAVARDYGSPGLRAVAPLQMRHV